MPKVYRVTLTEERQDELIRRLRDPMTPPRTRERLEMLRLSNAGLTIPRIAPIVRQSEQRVRHWIKRYLETLSFDAVEDAPHAGRISSLTEEDMAALRQEIEKGDRTWTAPQAAEWLKRERGLELSRSQVARRLKREGLVWKRTSRSLRHKQTPEAVEAKKETLQELEKKGTKA